MQKQRFTMVVATHLFLIREDKLLITRRFQTGYEDGNFSVPAGHVDGGESIKQATIREALEEVGVVVKEKDLNFVGVFHRQAARESIDFFFACTKWKHEPQIMEADKADQLEWVEISDLPQNTIPYIRTAVGSYLGQIPYQEVNY